MDFNEYRLQSEKRWADFSVKVQKIEDTVSVMETKIDKQAKLVEDIQQLSTSVSILANNMKSMLEEQKKQSSRIAIIEQKPGKRWDAVVDKVLMLLIAALISGVLIKLGLPA